MIPTCCVTDTTDRKITIRENGRKATFANEKQERFSIAKIDDCVIRTGPRCDYLLRKATQGDLLLEFKGSDVAYAAQQIMATANHGRLNGYLAQNIAALVVSARYPRFDTTVQRAKLSFAKKYKGPMTIVSRNCEHDFGSLFRFR